MGGSVYFEYWNSKKLFWSNGSFLFYIKSDQNPTESLVLLVRLSIDFSPSSRHSLGGKEKNSMLYAVVNPVFLDEALRLMTTSEALLSLLWLLQCDGTDLTPKIQDLKFQCIVFLNIPR